MEKITLPQNITRELISDLRLRGRRTEAKVLLEARKTWMKEERKNDKREIINYTNRIKAFLNQKEE